MTDNIEIVNEGEGEGAVSNALEALNSSNLLDDYDSEGLKYQSFNDILPGEYTIYHFAVIKTKFGKRVRIGLESNYMILPERFTNSLTEENLDILNRNPIIMCYSGKDTSQHNRLMIHFRSVYYSEE